MQKLDDDGKRTVEQLHILSGETYNQSKIFLTHLVSVLIMDYLNGNTTTIPYLGTIKLKNIGDKMVPTGKEAIIEIDFEADSYIKKILGQIADGIEFETEIEKTLSSRVKPKLSEIIVKD